MTFMVRNIKSLHQLSIAYSYITSVNLCKYSLSAYLFDIRHTRPVNFLSISHFKALADWVGGGAFCKGCILYKPCIFHLTVMNCTHLKHSLSQSSCLVKGHNLSLRQGFKEVRAFYQYALLACATYSCKEAKRYTYD